MILKELINQLVLGELKSFSFSDGGVLKPDALPAIIDSINMSLNDLYTRFLLNEKELHILCFANKTKYPLRQKYAASDPTPDVPKYILDTPDYPFNDDLIQIISATDEMGRRVTINDAGHFGSIFIPRYDTIQVTNPTNSTMLVVTYQAKHPTIKVPLADCEIGWLQDIILPPILEEALRTRIAFRTYAPMDREGSGNKAAVLEIKYDKICAEAEQKNLINSTAFSTTSKLEARGFV